MIDDKEIYARVKNGKVIEYPVSGLHIRNRRHPIQWYTRCVEDVKPQATEVQYLKSSLTVGEYSVIISFNVVDYTLDELLTLHSTQDPVTNTATPPDITTLSPLTVSTITDLATKLVQSKLDEFANGKGYDNIQSVTTYVNSTVLAYSTDATTAINLRDQTWTALFTYLTGVQAGTIPVPTKTDEILAFLPTLVW